MWNICVAVRTVAPSCEQIWITKKSSKWIGHNECVGMSMFWYILNLLHKLAKIGKISDWNNAYEIEPVALVNLLVHTYAKTNNINW